MSSELESSLGQGPMFDEELPPGHRSGFVALMGKPNVGKSTLLNAWLGTKLAPVSPKPQTTRNRLLGILTRRDAQLIFVDTPGIHKARTKLGDYMVEVAERAIPDSDVIVFVTDLSTPTSRPDHEMAELCKNVKQTPVILAMNKMDLVSGETMEKRRTGYEALRAFDESVCISALLGDGVEELLQLVISRLPHGPRYYPENQISDRQERFIAADLIREQALRYLEQEVPHALAVIVQEMQRRPNGVMYILANIYTEKDSQKGIVIGRKGKRLKQIGHDARIDLQKFLGCKVYLELRVKVRKHWRQDESLLRRFGYTLSGEK